MPGPGERGERRLYGRRKGRPLSARQERVLAELLPRLKLDLAAPPPVPLASLFGPSVTDIWLEIGFGAGEHLAWQAKAHPHVGLIGCEPFITGAAQALGKIEDEGLGNVRVHADDVRSVLDWLPEGSLGRVFVLFPDPWPKTRHHKRRLIQPATLSRLARLMRPGAELRIATDIGDYARASLLAARAAPAFRWTADSPRDWRERPAGWPPTRYERKAVAQGRQPVYLAFLRQ